MDFSKILSMLGGAGGGDMSNILSMLGGSGNGGGGDMASMLSKIAGGGGGGDPMASLLPMLMQMNNKPNNSSPQKSVAVPNKKPMNDNDVNFTLYNLSKDEM